MQTRSPDPRSLILPGAFALTCIVLTVLAFIAFGGSVPLAPEGYRVIAPFPQAANLVPGSDVEIAGVTIGRVASITRGGNHADVTLQIDPSFAPFRYGTRVQERTKTLLGEGYVAVTPARRGAPRIPDGGLIPASAVKPTVALDQFLSTFDPKTRTQMRRLFGGLSTAFGPSSPALNDSLGYAAPVTANGSAVLDAVAAQGTDLRRLISTSSGVLAALGNNQGALQAAVTAGQAVLSATASRNRALTATIDALPSFVRALHSASVRITADSPVLGAAVSALEPSARLLPSSLDKIDRAAPSFRGLFTQLPATLRAGRQGLPALKAIVAATRPALAEFYPTARNLIPFMQLFGVNRDIIDILANVASVNSGSYVAPGGVVMGSASGVVSAWNETISGWAHKLPTNRQEPYPAPGALLETGTIGVLKSYDCRNVHNPLYLPATGLGAPPCILQGPWTFDGKSAYYPRLTLASP